MKKQFSISAVAALMIVAAALAFTGTYLVYSAKLSAMDASMADSQKLIEINDYIKGSFIADYDNEAMQDAAAEAMVNSLGDRWSYYLTADDYSSYLDRVSNSYVGIGVTISSSDSIDGFKVTGISAGGGAEAAGIQVGDIITAVEGKSVTELGLDETKELIAGESGTTVSITIIRSGAELEVSIERRVVSVEAVSSKLISGNVGIITIKNFDADVSTNVSEQLSGLIAQGAKALVFDVRNNPGGRLTELLGVLDPLLPEGTLFISRDNQGNEQDYSSDSASLSMPMAVLVNEDSYSAAEYFAAILQEDDWADIIGTKTCGKGYSQVVLALSDGSAVGLSTGAYFTPSGKSLKDVGVTPDYTVTMSDEENAELYYGKLAVSDDEQLQTAVEVVKSELGE